MQQTNVSHIQSMQYKGLSSYLYITFSVEENGWDFWSKTHTGWVSLPGEFTAGKRFLCGRKSVRNDQEMRLL